MRRDAAVPAPVSLRTLYVPMALLAVLVAVVTAVAVSYSVGEKLKAETARLQTIAGLKAEQLQNWLGERERDAMLLRGSDTVAERYHRWQAGGDSVSYQRLVTHLERFRSKGRYGSIMMLDPQGRVLWHSSKVFTALDPAMRDAMLQAARSNDTRRVGPYRDAGGRIHLDYAVPLPGRNGHPGPLLVLHADEENYLFPRLRDWPVPSDSGEVVLVRRVGDEVEYLGALKREPDAALKLRRPISEPFLLSARLVRQGPAGPQILEGIDYSGEEVVGVGHKVAGTDWLLLAKMDKRELYFRAGEDAVWIALIGILALFLSVGGLYLARQRRQLLVSQAVQAAQAESLRSLQLLAAIADSSSDVIYAKDTEGRYTLFNREAARIAGKTVAAVLGHDDKALLPPEQAATVMANDRRVMDENRLVSYEEELDTAGGKITFLATKGPLHGDDGSVAGLFCVARDISAIKRTQDALRQERDLNQRYLDTMQTLMLALDKDGRITMINRKGCELLGYAEDELLGRDWFAVGLPQPGGKERAYPIFQRIMGGHLEGAEYVENPILCRDGSQRQMAWHNAYLTDAAGQVVGTLSSGEDITERQTAEETLRRQAEELTRRNAELERFNRAMVGRELDMIALKRRVNELAVRLGEQPPYDLGFTAAPGDGEVSHGA